MQQKNSIDFIRDKIYSNERLELELTRLRFFSKKIVFTNGCFDILHLGHIDYLAKAADEGDVLIVGLNSDASITGLKGPSRPVNDEEQRSMILASLHFVNAVIIFNDPTPYQLIRTVQPDVLVKGGDYKADEIVGADIVKAKHGVIKIIDFLPGYSTTKIEEKIRAFKK